MRVHPIPLTTPPIKVVIQLPCFNEEASLPVTLASLPRALPGVDSVEWLVVNDGSTDGTVAAARRAGVDTIVDRPNHQGLARAFMAGLRASLARGADVIVNTDADNQYRGEEIGALVAPILRGEADIVVGARPIDEIDDFSGIKKKLERLGSWVVRLASRTAIPDAPSGFRAFSREAALQLNVFGEYTYTLETLIQAGQRGLIVTSVPIHTNGCLRPSRLVRSVPNYVVRSLLTVLRIFMIYRPARFFGYLGAIPFAAGLAFALRYLALLAAGTERTHAPSLILAAILLLAGLSLWIFGLLADLLAVNRRLLEEIQLEERRKELTPHEN